MQCWYKFTFYLRSNTVKPRKRRFPVKLDEFHEHYSITIKPKLLRRNSLSDLATNASDFNLEYLEPNFWREGSIEGCNIYNYAGDFSDHVNSTYMSWNLTGKKKKKGEKMVETYATKYAKEYIQKHEPGLDPSISSNNSSMSCADIVNKATTFPFKSTPSGNLKVQSDQVVFQSPTVGVLLADPNQAKVKVKFEMKSADETDPDVGSAFEQDTPRDKTVFMCNNSNCPDIKKDKGKNLCSLGYTLPEAIDWKRIQLPKKTDLFQEFFRRIHSYTNTDTVIHIGDEDFHCHHMVLEVYSTFFEKNPEREIELPIKNVTPDAFQTVYEWMIFNDPESTKLLKTSNVLEILSAAQFLSINDLRDQCWSFIVDENIFNEDTAFALFRDARNRCLPHIMEIMVPRVMRFFLPLVSSTDYLELEPDEIITFLKSNYICITSEIEVLMAGIRWLYGDWPKRQRFAVEVMSCVRFGLISPWQLVDLKRNPDNAEILDIVNEPEIQQMVDDGLAYVIIKYWYGNDSNNYYHWIDVLGLTEPAERNWIGEEKNHVTYKDFLKYLEQFMVPKDQMLQTLAMMPSPRRAQDISGHPRGIDADKMEMRRPKMDFPLPANLRGLSVPKDKAIPTMSEFFEKTRKVQQTRSPPSPSSRFPFSDSKPTASSPKSRSPRQSLVEKPKPPDSERRNRKDAEQQKLLSPTSLRQKHTIQQERVYDEAGEPPERDSTATGSEISSTPCSSIHTQINQDKRHSIAAAYLAAATAALSSSKIDKENSNFFSSELRQSTAQKPPCQAPGNATTNNVNSPQISLFNQSKESLARRNMNKLSASILGPSNKSYLAENSLFNWDRETVLVFGGIDPHSKYGVGRNTGRDIYRFDPVSNVWDHVGDLPEPRHHHSVAFLRGRVYLVGGADPRDDDIRGKSVVVSTVWSYEPVTRAWFSESGLTVPRKNFGLVVHRMALYAIGGQDKKGRVLHSVERFDPKSSSWSEMRPMGTARMAVACAKYRDYIWVAGGMTGEKKKPVCKIVECYNSKTNEWTEIHNLRFPRCFASLFSMNDKLFIIGGAGRVSDKDKTPSSVHDIDVWDWKTREWKFHTQMSIPRHGHALAYLGTQLFIIGGVTTIYMRALNNVESYCCERGAWIRGVATLLSPLSGHGAVTLPPASLM